jgi:hypothetical protein
MVQSRFVECGKILKSDFTKGFSMERFVPIFAIDGEGVAAATDQVARQSAQRVVVGIRIGLSIAYLWLSENLLADRLA